MHKICVVLSLIVFLMAAIACTSSEPNYSGPKPPKLPSKLPFDKKTTTQALEVEPSPQMSFSEVDGIPADLKQQCAVAICGDPAQVVAPWPSNWQVKEVSDQERGWLEKDIDSRVQMILDLQEENAKRSIEHFDASVSRLRKTQMDASHLAYANAVWFGSHVREAYGSLRVSEDGSRWVVDEAALARALPSMSALDLQYMKAFMDDFLSSWEWNVIFYVGNSGIADALRVLDPQKTPLQVMQNIGEAMTLQIGQLQNRFGEMEIEQPRSVVAMREGRDLTPELAADLVSALFLAYYGRMVGEQNLFASRPAPDLEVLINRYTDSVLGNIKEQLADPKKLAEDRSAIWNSCSYTLVYSWQKSPTRAEIASAKIWLEDVKARALQEGLAFVSDSAQEKNLKEKLPVVQFDLPIAKEDMIEPMKSGFNIEMQKQLRLQQSGVIASDMDLLLKIYADSAMEVRTVFETPATCTSFAPPELTDHALTGFGLVSLSAPIMKFPQFGKAVAAHEIGHMIEGYLREGHQANEGIPALVKGLTCIEGRHGQMTNTEFWQYSSEDFADEIASRVVKKLIAIGEAPANKGCLLMGHDGKTWGGRGLSLRNPTGWADGHSTDFFRTLAVQIASGQKLPEVCQGLVSQYAPQMQTSCE